jgi:hypothetical protein
VGAAVGAEVADGATVGNVDRVEAGGARVGSTVAVGAGEAVLHAVSTIAIISRRSRVMIG